MRHVILILIFLRTSSVGGGGGGEGVRYQTFLLFLLPSSAYHERDWPPCKDTLSKTGSESIEVTLRRRWNLFAGFVARMEDTRLPKCVMFGELVGGAGCVGGQEKEWMRCLLDDLRASGINAHQRTTAAQEKEEWRRMAEQGAEHFMAKWIVAEKTKAGLRHAVVCPNVTGRTKKRIAQRKRARAGFALVDQPQVARTCILRALVCRWHGVCPWCFVCFVLLRFRLYAFVEAAALRSIVLRHAGVPIATRFFLFFVFLFVYLEISLFPSIFCTISAFSY